MSRELRKWVYALKVAFFYALFVYTKHIYGLFDLSVEYWFWSCELSFLFSLQVSITSIVLGHEIPDHSE